MTRKKTPSGEGTDEVGAPSESGRGSPRGPTAAGIENPTNEIAKRLLGPTEPIMRSALGVRLRIAPDVPWPDLILALDPVDPELAAMLRRFFRLSPPIRGATAKRPLRKG